MRRSHAQPTIAARIALALGIWCLPAALGCGAGASVEFVVETVADGVEFYRPADGGPNSTVVVRADGLLLIDAQPDVPRARALASSIRARHTEPVRYVVVSHPHRESAGGASVFTDALLIAAADAAAALADPDFDYDAELDAPDGSTPAGRPTPTLLVGGEIELADPRVPVRIIPGSSGHAPGELIVGIHGGTVIHAGGLPFADRLPFGGTASVTRWISTLNRLSRQAPVTILGTRGPALDLAEFRRRRDALAWLRGQVQEAFLRGTTWERMPAEIAAEPQATEYFALDGGTSHLESLAVPAVEEFRDQRRKRGLTD